MKNVLLSAAVGAISVLSISTKAQEKIELLPIQTNLQTTPEVSENPINVNIPKPVDAQKLDAMVLQMNPKQRYELYILMKQLGIKVKDWRQYEATSSPSRCTTSSGSAIINNSK